MPNKPLQVVSCLIFDENGRMLLLKRHAEDLGGGLWAAPGGTIEQDETPDKTLIREVKEETGLVVSSAEYLGSHELQMPHGTAHIRTFQAKVTSSVAITIDPFEHESYGWFELVNLLNLESIIWGLPTTLLDFGFMSPFQRDPTLADGSKAILLEIATE